MRIFRRIFGLLLITCSLSTNFLLQGQKGDPYKTVVDVICKYPNVTQKFITNLRRNILSWEQAIDQYGADLNLEGNTSSVLMGIFLRRLQKKSIGKYEFAQKLQNFLIAPLRDREELVIFLKAQIPLNDLTIHHNTPPKPTLTDPYEEASTFFSKSSSDALKNLVVYLQNKELTWGSMIRLYKEDLEYEGIKLPTEVEAFLMSLYFKTEFYLFILAETLNCFIKGELNIEELAKSLKTYFPLQKIETHPIELPQNSISSVSSSQDLYTSVAQYLLAHREISESLITNLYNEGLSSEDVLILFESAIENNVPDYLLANIQDLILYYITRDDFADHLNMLLWDGDINTFAQFLKERVKAAQEYNDNDEEEEAEDRRLTEL